MDPNDDEGSGDAGPVSAMHARVRQLSRHQHPDNRRSWSGDCSPPGVRSRSWSSSSHRQMSPVSPGGAEDVTSHVSRDASPVTYRPVSGSRSQALRYSGGAGLHGMDQPTSFDHNFDSTEPPDKASSSSPPRRPHRRQREGSGSPAPISVTHLSRQLPPLVRVQADLDAENLGSTR